MLPFSTRAVPLLLFLLNLTVGLLFINEGLFHMDSVALAMAVEKTYQTGVLHPGALGRYGAVLVNSILYFPFYLLHLNAELVTRFSSVLFHSLSVVAFYYFIQIFFSDRIQALFGALLLSFTPLYFNPNTYGKEHGMGIFFLLLSFFLLQRSMQKLSPLRIALASCAYVFAIAVRESQLSTLPLFILLFLSPEITWRPFKISLPPGRISPRIWMAFAAPLLTLLSIMLGCYLLQSARDAEFHDILGPTLIPALESLGGSIPWPVFAFLLIGIFQMAVREKPFLTIFFILWLMLFFIHGCTKWYTPRFLDVVLIPIYVFAAYSLRIFFSQAKLAASAIVLFCVLSMFLYLYPMISFRHHYNGEKRLAEYIHLRTEPDAVIITVNQFPFIQYYGKRETVWLPINGTSYAVDLFLQKVDHHLKAGRPVYYTDSSYLKGYELSSLYTITKYFDLELVGGALSEDYLRPELQFRFGYQKLYKVFRK